MKTATDLAGIIPIAGQKRVDYVFPWHDCLMPLDKDYYAIQRSVYECALAGCKVIWVVSDLEFQPLIREIVGDWVMDPFSIDRKNRLRETFEHVRVPIYYLPIHPKDRERRDCLAWSILYGANVANKVSRKISKWSVFDKFWVSFPQGVYDPDVIEPSRRGKGVGEIQKLNNNFCLTYEGKSVTNGVQAGFTLSTTQLEETTKHFKSMEVARFFVENGKKKKRPMKESYVGRFFSLDKVFENLYSGLEVETLELQNFYQIDTFSGYRELMGSNLDLEKPRAIERFERKKRKWRRMFQE